jgi:hypothetical protein
MPCLHILTTPSDRKGGIAWVSVRSTLLFSSRWWVFFSRDRFLCVLNLACEASSGEDVESVGRFLGRLEGLGGSRDRGCALECCVWICRKLEKSFAMLSKLYCLDIRPRSWSELCACSTEIRSCLLNRPEFRSCRLCFVCVHCCVAWLC